MEQGGFSFGGELVVFGEELAPSRQPGTRHREGSAGCGLRTPAFESLLCCSELDKLPYLSEFCLFPLLRPSLLDGLSQGCKEWKPAWASFEEREI